MFFPTSLPSTFPFWSASFRPPPWPQVCITFFTLYINMSFSFSVEVFFFFFLVFRPFFPFCILVLQACLSAFFFRPFSTACGACSNTNKHVKPPTEPRRVSFKRPKQQTFECLVASLFLVAMPFAASSVLAPRSKFERELQSLFAQSFPQRA